MTVENTENGQSVGYKGEEFRVRDNDGNHLGDFVVQQARVIWCPGRTTPANGVRVPWEEFIDTMENI